MSFVVVTTVILMINHHENEMIMRMRKLWRFQAGTKPCREMCENQQKIIFVLLCCFELKHFLYISVMLYYCCLHCSQCTRFEPTHFKLWSGLCHESMDLSHPLQCHYRIVQFELNRRLNQIWMNATIKEDRSPRLLL